MEPKKESQKLERKRISRSFFLLVIYLVALLFLYYIFIQFNANPLLALIIIFFVLLVFIGPIFKFSKSRSQYTKMFPDKKRVMEQKKLYKSQKKEMSNNINTSLPRDIKKVDLSINYRRPIISKCHKCGMIIPSLKSIKKCPNCQEPIIL